MDLFEKAITNPELTHHKIKLALKQPPVTYEEWYKALQQGAFGIQDGNTSLIYRVKYGTLQYILPILYK